VPTASIVVDFAAHGLWVDPDVDVHFCLHDDQAARVRSLGARQAEATGPVVAPAFSEHGVDRAEARRRLGLGDGDRAVLIVAGSWGAGHIERTARAVAADGRFRPLVVTGSNTSLQRRLQAAGCGDVFGWVDDMAALMIAADVMVENAGGLMAMEAMAVGTPVVSFGPIPGHGRENVIRMDAAGVSRYATSEAHLLDLLDRVVTDEAYRKRLTATADGMFRADIADRVAAMVRRPAPAGPVGSQALT
ncbi:MAG TPA: glycosyltransferase, partial [Acidimicrobiales bacterium]|nr:glycosyltransferase [Acidimicrobiales bacterium]